MSEKFKQIDKKYLMIIGGIAAILILIIIVAVVVRILSGPGTNYVKLEEKMASAAEKYIKSDDHPSPEPGESTVVTTDVLIAEGYLKELNKYVKDTCSGSVTIMNNGGSALYLPELKCSEYATTHINTRLIDDSLVVDGDEYESGLYEDNGEYIFKGKSVNNYVSLGGQIWRVLKIDADGNLRLISNTHENKKVRWDYKYNSEAKKNYGINDYENSELLETLNASYAKFKEQNKKHLIAHDVCVGKRSSSDYSLDISIDCAEKLEKQYIGTINSVDYAMASLDENCTSINSGSCRNYNYLSSNFAVSWSTTALSDNSYEAILIGNGYVNNIRTDKKYNYYWVIYLSGQESYKSGTGTLADPYVIK
jgi:hypothetical protein